MFVDHPPDRFGSPKLTKKELKHLFSCTLKEQRFSRRRAFKKSLPAQYHNIMTRSTWRICKPYTTTEIEDIFLFSLLIKLDETSIDYRNITPERRSNNEFYMKYRSTPIGRINLAGYGKRKTYMQLYENPGGFGDRKNYSLEYEDLDTYIHSIDIWIRFIKDLYKVGHYNFYE